MKLLPVSQHLKFRTFLVLGAVLFSLNLVFPLESHSQILQKSILDLRSRIAKHKWSFRPGDSPQITRTEKDSVKRQIELESMEQSDDLEEAPQKNIEEISFAWAAPQLSPEHAKGWIDDFWVQRTWTRYRDKNGTRPFMDHKKYVEEYKGYGWYRTTFTITENDLLKKFKSKDLQVRLGKIGQADAVYLNGHYIGGTGLKPDTKQNTVLPDTQLFYDKIRYYDLPKEYLNLGKENVLAVRVYAKYNIAPGLSHDRYYIASARKMDRSQYWDDFKKIFVMVISVFLGIFYIYWQILFRENDRASIFFSLTAFSMALNTFLQSQTVYSMWNNGLWLKKWEFISIILFVHLLMEFLVNFTKVHSRVMTIINRACDALGVAAIAAMVFIPNLLLARQFMFAWSVAPALLFLYIIYIMIKGRKIPSMTFVSIGFLGMVILMLNDVLVGMQFRWVMWEISFKDYAFAFFGITSAASIVSNMKKSRELIEQQKAEKERLSKYFSPDVVDTILQGKISLGGEEKQIVTLFADIVGFTAFSEHHKPAEVVSRLNEMFTKISSSIFNYQATLDKYIGDCVMAFWGAPKSSPKDAYNAVSCALKMQEVVEALNKKLPEGENPFKLRIGINYGASIVGNIGSTERMDYTVIGDAVNTASRIESNGIPGRVAISEAVFLAAGGESTIKYSETRDVMVKGKKEPIKIYIIESIGPWTGPEE